MPQPLTPRLEMDETGWEELGQGCGGWEVLDSEAGEGGRRNEFGGTSPHSVYSLSIQWALGRGDSEGEKGTGGMK